MEAQKDKVHYHPVKTRSRVTLKLSQSSLSVSSQVIVEYFQKRGVLALAAGASILSGI
jgi:hypothetical protein